MEPPSKGDPKDVGVPSNAQSLPFNEAHYWELWVASKNMDAREALLAYYMPYARIVAASYYAKRTLDDIEFSEYLQFASVGLLESMERFDPALGVQFKTFAARRMHGAILDGIQHLSEKNEQILFRKALKKERLHSLKKLCNDSSEPSSQFDKENLFRYLADIGIGLAISLLLEGTGMIGGEEKPSFTYSPEVQYFRQDEIHHLRRILNEKILKLSKQEQLLIQYHYLQENSFEKIAEIFGVTRGRVSQIHRQALQRLRELLSQRCDVTL